MNSILDHINISRNRRVVQNLNAKSIKDVNHIIEISDFSNDENSRLLKYLLERTFDRSEHPGIRYAKVKVENENHS